MAVRLTAEEASPPADVSVAAVVEAGTLLERVPNPSARAYLQKRMDGLLSLTNTADRVARFDAFLTELRSATARLPAGTNEMSAVDVPSPPLASTSQSGVGPEAEAINLLTTYACILYDLEHRGFDQVRRELVDNIDSTALRPETIGMLRQLVMICDEAERIFSKVADLKEDGAAETRSLWWQNLGAYGAASVATGDPLPLLQAAAGIVRGREKVKTETQRKIDIETQNHRGRLTNFLFELNLQRSRVKREFGLDETAFLTKETYDLLQQALLDPNPRTRLGALRQCVSRCPAFREGLYYLAAAYHAADQLGDAEQCLVTLTTRKSALLRSDGLLGGAYDILADYSLRRGDASNAVALATLATVNQPDRGSAYHHLSQAHWRLGDVPAAVCNLDQAMRLEPANGDYLWTAAQMASTCYTNEDAALTFLEAAIRSGFTNFAAVYEYEPLRDGVASPRGQDLLQPSLMALCSRTVLNQQFSVSNAAPYKLTGVNMTLRAEYENGAGSSRPLEWSCLASSFSNGAVIVLGLVRSASDGRCRMRLSYTCAQHPGRAFETESCFNYLSGGETLWWADYQRQTRGEREPARPKVAPENPGRLRELLGRLKEKNPRE
jgi:hypothetical protein